jgi:S-adenosylmethionine-diacylglycerol 3-amino-3-carboxypropyl transferase
LSKVQVVFGQVREDSRVECGLLRRLPDNANAFVIASGGDTALSLLTLGHSNVTAVDTNPAQIFLTELKSKALQMADFELARRCFYTEAPGLPARLKSELSENCYQFWQTNQNCLDRGMNNCGLVDQKLQKMINLFYLLVNDKEKTRVMLTQTNIKAQQNYYHREFKNWRWDLALKLAFRKDVLALTYGNDVKSLPATFAQTMATKVERLFTTFPTAYNGFLWQTFLTDYPENEEALPPYLQKGNRQMLQFGMSRFHLQNIDAVSYLKEQPANSIDFFALTNILEAAKPEYIQQLANEIGRVARAGGLVCARFISPHPDPLFEDERGRLIFDKKMSDELEQVDQSCFCSFFQIYRVR